MLNNIILDSFLRENSTFLFLNEAFFDKEVISIHEREEDVFKEVYDKQWELINEIFEEKINFIEEVDQKEAGDERERIIKYNIEKFCEEVFFKIHQETKEDILKMAEETGIPKEAILSVILVEDIRYYIVSNPRFAIKNPKSFLRRILPDAVLEAVGHKANPEAGKSHLGLIHRFNLYGNIIYLKSLGTLDTNTLKLLGKVSLPEEIDDPSFISVEGLNNIEEICITLKAQIEFWKRNGFDIFSHDFKNINTFGERIGLLETLNNLCNFVPNGIIYEEDGQETFYEEGFYNTFGDHINEHKKLIVKHKPRKIIPNNNAKLGGANFWMGTETNYGEIVKIFVDSGLAESFFEK